MIRLQLRPKLKGYQVKKIEVLTVGIDFLTKFVYLTKLCLIPNRTSLRLTP